MDRTSFYEWRRRFQTHGFAGLKDLPPIARSHPQTTPPELVDRIRELALAHPAYGCNRIEALLALEGRRVSAITVQKILNDQGLGTRHERWLALERRRNAEEPLELSPEQVAFLEKLNPCFRERHVESSKPGELLCQDTFFVGALKGGGRVYLHAVVDTYGFYAFFPHVTEQPEAAVAVLHNEALPFYRDLGPEVGAILTDNGREFCGSERHPYELDLARNDIEHRKTRVRSPETDGFVARFHGTVPDEFFRATLRQTFYDSVEALQADLDAWLVHDNRQRPHLGYRNQGRRPWETVESFVRQED